MTTTEELERRIEKLEARLASTLEVSRLRVLGARGRAVLEVGASPDGEPEIVLLDALGRDRVMLRLVENEAALEFVSEDGRPQLRCAAGDSASRVVLWSPREERRAEMRAGSDGTAVVAIVEDRESPRALFGVTARGEAIVRCEPKRAEDAT